MSEEKKGKAVSSLNELDNIFEEFEEEDATKKKEVEDIFADEPDTDDVEEDDDEEDQDDEEETDEDDADDEDEGEEDDPDKARKAKAREMLSDLFADLDTSQIEDLDKKVLETKPDEVTLGEEVFFTEDDLANLEDRPDKLVEKLNKTLNQIKLSAVTDAIKVMAPSVNKTVDNTVNLRLAANNFYSKNEDLNHPGIRNIVRQRQH